MAWDVLSWAAEMALDISGVANLRGMFCPGCQTNGIGCFVPGWFVLYSVSNCMNDSFRSVN